MMSCVVDGKAAVMNWLSTTGEWLEARCARVDNVEPEPQEELEGAMRAHCSSNPPCLALTCCFGLLGECANDEGAEYKEQHTVTSRAVGRRRFGRRPPRRTTVVVAGGRRPFRPMMGFGLGVATGALVASSVTRNERRRAEEERRLAEQQAAAAATANLLAANAIAATASAERAEAAAKEAAEHADAAQEAAEESAGSLSSKVLSSLEFSPPPSPAVPPSRPRPTAVPASGGADLPGSWH